MPKFVRGRRFTKLPKEEQERNKDCVFKCSRMQGPPRWRLKACEHSASSELVISPLWYCVMCIWESVDTDTEYDPALAADEYDSDFYYDNQNK